VLVSAVCADAITPISTHAGPAQTRAARKLTPAEEDNIREAVFRYLFWHNASSLQFGARVYYLSVGYDEDPTDEFISRFKGHTPPVKKLSLLKDELKVINRERGNWGLIFTVAIIQPLTRNKVIVDGGYYEGPLSSSGNTYTVERVRGKWVVTKDLMRWIS
jgi:hypothetical protein